VYLLVFSRIFLLGILFFKGLTVRHLYKSFSGVKGLTRTSALVEYLRVIGTLVHGHEQDEERNVSFPEPLLTPSYLFFMVIWGKKVMLVTRL
jgi:hypothetical protein